MISIKVCGITCVDDALACVDAGVDRLGLNFVPASPRLVDVESAREIVSAVRHRAEVFAVVADLTLERANELRASTGIDWLQLHGDEPDESVLALGPQALKAVRLGDERDVARALAVPGRLVLVDAKVPHALGGTGASPPVELAARVARARPTIVAGGLSPDNVARWIELVRPAGVDVASGVEDVHDRRRKAHDSVRRFVSAVRGACGRLPQE